MCILDSDVGDYWMGFYCVLLRGLLSHYILLFSMHDIELHCYSHYTVNRSYSFCLGEHIRLFDTLLYF